MKSQVEAAEGHPLTVDAPLADSAAKNSTTSRCRSALLAFLFITFGVSWGCWIPAALSEEGLSSSWVRWLSYAGALGPAAAGVALTYLSQDEAPGDYWARVAEVSRIRLMWLIPVLLLYPLATFLALLFDIILTGAEPRLQTASRLLADPSSIAVFVLSVLLFGPVPEELGWRGYALDRLQRNWGALTSSLILGIVWAVWHLPLFFVKGSYQYNLGFGSPSFWSYGVAIMALSVLFTWIYNNNARSTLAAILFHFVLNLTGSVAQGSAAAEVSRSILLVAVAALVTRAWTPLTLSTRRPS